MKIKRNTVILFSILFMVFYTGCDSSDIEMEQADMTDSTSVAGINEIKNEVEKPKPEIKEEFQKQQTILISKPPLNKYTVQIGAYEVETNAMDMLNNAQSHFGIDVYYDLIGTIYKIRVGKYSSIEEALVLLSKIKNTGFLDAFITEVGK